MDGHPCGHLTFSRLVPIMLQRLNGTRGAKAGKRATKDTGVPGLTIAASAGCGIASERETPQAPPIVTELADEDLKPSRMPVHIAVEGVSQIYPISRSPTANFLEPDLLGVRF